MGAYSPEQVQLLRAVDITGQRLAYGAALLCITILSVAGLLGWKHGDRLRASLPARWLARARRCVSRYGGPGIATTILLWPKQRSVETAWSVALVIVGALVFSPLRNKWAPRLLFALVALDLAFLMLPGLFETVDFSRKELWYLNATEGHFSAVVGAADRVASGRSWFDGAEPYYGLVPIALLATLQHRVGMLDMGGHIRFIQMLQIAFLLLAAASFHLWKPRGLAFLIIALLLVVPWLENNHEAILRPNQSAWRMLGLPLGLLVLLLARGRTMHVAALLLGFTATFLILYNPETGLCLTGGYLVYLALHRDFRHAPAVLAAFLVGVIAQLALFWLLLGIGLGDWSLLPKLSGMAALLRRYAGFPRGMTMTFDPLALLIFAHATVVVLRAALQRSAEPLSSYASARAAIAAITVAWFSYYVSRPHPWNLWTFFFLYPFLIAPFLDARLWTLFRRFGARGFVPVPIVLLALLVGPPAIGALKVAHQDVLTSIQATRKPTAGIPLSGVRLARQLANPLEEKAAFLRELGQRETPVYFSADAYFLLLLSGVDDHLPFLDPFVETMTNEDLANLRAKTLALAPPHILFDATNIDLGTPLEERHFLARVMRSLSGAYRLQVVNHGWQVLERIDPAAHSFDQR